MTDQERLKLLRDLYEAIETSSAWIDDVGACLFCRSGLGNPAHKPGCAWVRLEAEVGDQEATG